MQVSWKLLLPKTYSTIFIQNLIVETFQPAVAKVDEFSLFYKR